MTRRNRGKSIEQIIDELNPFLLGWVTFFRFAECIRHLKDMDEWLRRKLRCLRLKQCKRPKPIADFLRCRGVPEWRAWLVASSGKGWWRLSGSPPVTEGMSLAWFESIGLVSLHQRYRQLNG